MKRNLVWGCAGLLTASVMMSGAFAQQYQEVPPTYRSGTQNSSQYGGAQPQRSGQYRQSQSASSTYDNDRRSTAEQNRNRYQGSAFEDDRYGQSNRQRSRADEGQFDERYDRYDSARSRSNADQDYADSPAGRSRTQSRDRGEQSWSEWWSSWWSDDSSGQSREQSSSAAARQFVHQHDDNGDSYISRNEMPSRMRSEFARVDSDRDGYLSQSEIRQHGTPNYDTVRSGSQRSGIARDGSRSYSRESTNRTARTGDSSDQSWSQWWASWWSDDNQSGTAEQIAARGAEEFIRRHDDNSDGYLTRSELPSGMYDQFTVIDRDDDRYLTRSEIQSYAARSRGSSSSSGRQASYSRSGSSASQGSSSDQRMSGGQSPRETVHVWIIDANQGHVSTEDLQEAYKLLAKIDTDGDGELSSSELRQRREQVVSEFCESCFQQLDQDDDGYLSRSEASSSVFADRFHQFDRDDDDSLTKSEIRRTLEERFDTASSTSSDTESESRR